jgi:hypothetical protein
LPGNFSFPWKAADRFFLPRFTVWSADSPAILFELGINWISLSTFVALSHHNGMVFLLG